MIFFIAVLLFSHKLTIDIKDHSVESEAFPNQKDVNYSRPLGISCKLNIFYRPYFPIMPH